MVRRHRPQAWHLALSGFLVCVAILGILYLPWHEEDRPGSGPPVLGSVRVPPTPSIHIDALADNLFSGIDPVLEELGIWASLIRKRRGHDGGSSVAVDTVIVQVPADLPLEDVNYRISHLVNRLGGKVLRAVENRRPRRVLMYCGLNGTTSTLFVIERAQVSRTGGRIAIVLDDFGSSSIHLVERFCALPQTLTLAVLPNEGEIGKIIDLAERHGHEVLAHMPMEPENFPEKNPGTNSIFVSQDSSRIRELVRRALRKIPSAVGLNNHMGSRATADRRVMTYVLREVDRRGLLFLDSRTASASVAYEVAQSLGIPSASRDLFIDPVDQAGAIEVKLWELADLAAENGQAVGIGHDRKETLLALERALPLLERRGFRFVPISEVAH